MPALEATIAHGWIHHDRLVLPSPCFRFVDPASATYGNHALGTLSFLRVKLADDRRGRRDEIADGLDETDLEHSRNLAPSLTESVILASRIALPSAFERPCGHSRRGTRHGDDLSSPQFGGERPVLARASSGLPIGRLCQTGVTTCLGDSVAGVPGRDAANAIFVQHGPNRAATIVLGRGVENA